MYPTSPWTRHLIEFTIIMLGILVAFWLNQWAQDRSDRRQFREKLNGVRGELSYNLAEVEQKLPYHDSLYTLLINDPSRAILRLNPAQIRNYAWQILQTANVENHLDYELYASLTETYNLQQGLQDHNQRMVDLIHLSNVMEGFVRQYSAMEDTGKDRLKQGWISILEDAIGHERALQNRYQQSLDKLDSLSR
jgi:hypothetical protein